MKPVLNPPDDLTALESLSMDLRVCTQCEGEQSSSFRLQRDAILRFGAWETELVWQVLSAIAEHHGDDAVALESLEEVRAALKACS